MPRDQWEIDAKDRLVRFLSETRRVQSLLEKWAPAHSMTIEDAAKRFQEEAGISRYGKPEEIAALMAFLVSPEAKWMTGTSVRIDGGEVKGV